MFMAVLGAFIMLLGGTNNIGVQFGSNRKFYL